MANSQPLPWQAHGASSCPRASLGTAIRSESKRARHDDGVDDDEEIVLDVGGRRFKTTRNTLCKEPNSVLEAMFSGRHENAARLNDDGSFFIDGDGTYFQHILNYLRVGAVVSLPQEDEEKEALAMEADFYGLAGLSRAIRMPNVNIYECLSEETRFIRNDEDAMRKTFLNGAAASFEPHRGLVSLFHQENGTIQREIVYEPLEDRTTLLMDRLREEAPPGTPVVVNTITEFRSNFNTAFPDVLGRLSDVLLEENVIIAGGSVLQALTKGPGIRTADWWGELKSDVDLFLYCSSPEEANRVASRVFFALALDDESWVVSRSSGVITMLKHALEYQQVQIVLRLYQCGRCRAAFVLFGLA